MTIRRAPLPPDFTPPVCDTPPAALGRVARPPHPLFGAGFAAVLGAALGFGAIGEPAAAPLALGVACLAACGCLAGIVHFFDGTAWHHVSVKLGLVRPRGRWLVVAGLAATPALGAVIQARFRAANPSQGGLEVAVAIAVVIAGAAWIETLSRGYAFRGCMGRHRFAIAASASAVVSLIATLPFVLVPARDTSHIALTLALELPLSISLAALVWRAGSILPALGIRCAILAACLSTEAIWPLAPAALIAWIASTRD